MGFVAHIDAGKTTTTERILYYTGRTHKMGEVHEGDTEMDWMDQERERGITITSAATTCYWRDHQINIIDTPGHVDFTAEVERSLRVLDGVVAIFSGVEMVEAQSEKVWRQADRYHIPRVAFVNKLDRVGADFVGTLNMMRERLGVIPLPTQIPFGLGDDFKGIIDLISMKLMIFDPDTKGAKYEYRPIPEDYREKARSFREELMEKLAEIDDEILNRYLKEEEISEEMIKKAIRKGCLEEGYVPVLGGSALKNMGIQPILDCVVDYLPSPKEVPPVKGTPLSETNGDKDKVETREADPDEPLACLAFKVTSDEYAQKLIFIRVYSGRLEKGSYLLNTTTGKKERISRIFLMHANKRTQVDSVSAGNIACIVGPKDLSTGDTLCDPDHPIVLERIEFPQPVISAAIEPASAAKESKLYEALYKLSQEDPTFDYSMDEETNQLIISGMGELHLEVLLQRLIRDFNVSANMGQPEVAYKESLTGEMDVEEKFVKQTGGRGQYGHVKIRFRPLQRGTGFKFVDEIRGGDIPKEYIKAVEKGVEEGTGSGPIGGYPVVDLEAVLYGGSHHPVDSSELAFKTAATKALRTGLKRAYEEGKIMLLEPIMEGEIICPGSHIGDVVDEINSRKGEIKEITSRDGTQIVTLDLPLSSSFGLATALRSRSQGRATHSLRFSHYAEVREEKEKVLQKKRF